MTECPDGVVAFGAVRRGLRVAQGLRAARLLDPPGDLKMDGRLYVLVARLDGGGVRAVTRDRRAVGRLDFGDDAQRCAEGYETRGRF